jgi:hypothetical protein
MLTARHQCRRVVLSLCMCLAVLHPVLATPPAEPVNLEAILQHLQDGELREAEPLLRALPIRNPDDTARRDRLLALLVQQRQLAAQLLRLAAGDLQRQDLPRAVERYETALTLDDQAGSGGRQAEALASARQRLWATRDAVASCMKRRDAACMDHSVAEARKLAPRDAALLLMELQASAWWEPGKARQEPAVDGTTGSSR